MKCYWELYTFPRASHNNNLCKMWGANRASKLWVIGIQRIRSTWERGSFVEISIILNIIKMIINKSSSAARKQNMKLREQISRLHAFRQTRLPRQYFGFE